MKSTGMVRKVDELGRIVIPIELRRSLRVEERDSLEIFVEDDKIILKKYVPAMTCIVSGENSNDNLRLANGKVVLSKDAAEQLIEEILSKK